MADRRPDLFRGASARLMGGGKPNMAIVVTAGGRALCAKLEERYPDNVEGRTEYERLLRFNRSGPPAGVGCPVPVFFDEASDVLLTEMVECRSLLRLYLAAGLLPTPSITRIVVRSVGLGATWARHLHLVESEVDGEDDWLEFTEHYLAEFARGPGAAVMGAARLDSAKEAVRRSWKARIARGPRLIRVHGDFGLSNIGVGKGGLVVFDLTSARAGSPWEDVGYFLTSLRLVTRARLLRRSLLRACHSAFLSRYIGPGAFTSGEWSDYRDACLQAVLRCAARQFASVERLPAFARDAAMSHLGRIYRDEFATAARPASDVSAMRGVG